MFSLNKVYTKCFGVSKILKGTFVRKCYETKVFHCLQGKFDFRFTQENWFQELETKKLQYDTIHELVTEREMFLFCLLHVKL